MVDLESLPLDARDRSYGDLLNGWSNDSHLHALG